MKASFVLNLLHVSHDKQHPVKVEYDSSRDQILQFLKTLPLQFIYYHFVQQYLSSTRARTHTPTLPPPPPHPQKKKKKIQIIEPVWFWKVVIMRWQPHG